MSTFERDPFAPARPGERYLALRCFEHALRELGALADSRDGVVCLVGDPGSGRTTLLREFCRRRDEPVVRFAEGGTRPLTGRALAGALLTSLTAAPDPARVVHPFASLASLADAVTAALGRAERLLLCIDDAHRLTERGFEVARLLAGRGACVVLAGERQILHRMIHAGVPTGADRVLHVSPLSPPDVADFVHLHLYDAGLQGDSPFTDQDLASLARASGGLPGAVLVGARMLLRQQRRSAHASRPRGDWRRHGVNSGLAVAAVLALVFAAALNRPHSTTASPTPNVSTVPAGFVSRVTPVTAAGPGTPGYSDELDGRGLTASGKMAEADPELAGAAWILDAAGSVERDL